MVKIIISRFREMPKTKTAWRAFGLGFVSLFVGPILGISAVVIVPAVSRAFGEGFGATFGSAVVFTALALTVAALVTSIRAFRYRTVDERHLMRCVFREWILAPMAIVCAGFI